MTPIGNIRVEKLAEVAGRLKQGKATNAGSSGTRGRQQIGT
jgi:hypothetical protein